MEIKVLASGSSGNAYTISDGSTFLLLDAGIPIREIQIGTGFRIRQLAGAFVTHEHKDHSKAMKDRARPGVDIYTSAGTLEACGLSGHRFHPVQAQKELDVGTFRILPFRVEHDAVEPLGFLFHSIATGEKLLYLTDTYFVRYRFKGLTHIMCECNFTNEGIAESVAEGRIPIEMVPRLVRAHMSLDNLLDMLRANDLKTVRQISLLHLSDNNSEAQRMKEAVQELTGVEVYLS